MGIFRTFDKIIAKATYDPTLEKQIAEERTNAREAKKNFRNGIQNLKVDLARLVEQNKITPEAVTLVKAHIKEAEKWLTDNPDATTDEINDKKITFMDTLAQIYDDDKGRIYHVYYTTIWNSWITSWFALNKISEEQAGKLRNIVGDEELWYKKHLKESPDVYIERINEMVDKCKEFLSGEQQKEVSEKMKEGLQATISQDEIDKARAQAKQAKEDREAVEKASFNAKRIATKAGSGILSALLLSIIICFALFGASLASNMALVRPTSIRILCWFYGLVFFIPVILYAIIQWKPPHFAAYLIPLYMYDPKVTEKTSFLEKLVWYKDDTILHQAQQTFQKAAETVIGTQ